MITIESAQLFALRVPQEMLGWFNSCFPGGSGGYQDVLDAMAADDRPDYAHLLLDSVGSDQDAVQEIDGSVQRKHVFAAGRLIVHGEIRIDGWMRAGLTILAENDVHAGLGIIAGWSAWVGGNIHSDGCIKASARIDAVGNIEAGQTIWSGCAIVAGGRIHSTMSVLVGKEDLPESPWSHRWNADLAKVFRDSRISITPRSESTGVHDNRCNSLLADCNTIGLRAAGDISAGDSISCATTIKASENISASRAILAGASIEAGDNIILGKRPFLEWQPSLGEGLESDSSINPASICGKLGVDNASEEHNMLSQDCKFRSVRGRPLIPGKGISVEGDIWCDGKILSNSINVRGSVFAARYVVAKSDVIVVGKELKACERIQGTSVLSGWGIESGTQIIADKKVQAGHAILAENIISYRRKAPDIYQFQSPVDTLVMNQETVCRPIQGVRLDLSDINQPQEPTQKQAKLNVFREENWRLPIIKVVGVGGAGCNALDYLASQNLEGIELIATNTDPQALARCSVSNKILLGNEGMAAGGHPDVGCRAACDSREQLTEALKSAHLVFIVAGLGGGTGTGAGPVIAKIANELGAFTIGLVTYPFQCEWGRSSNADAAIATWEKELSSLFVLSHDRLVEACDKDMSIDDAFKKINQLYLDAIRGVSEILGSPSLVNLNGRQVCSATAGMGTMYSGSACGADRARIATERAVSLQLSSGTRIADARSVLLVVTAARGMKQSEVSQVISAARMVVKPNVKLFLGTAYDDTLRENIRITAFAAQ